jgi:hypothetical protein
MTAHGTATRPATSRVRRALRTAGQASLVIAGAYLVLRALAEPFVINLGNPASYQNDWGGPQLIGVLLVHCGPGVAIVVLAVHRIRRRRRHDDSG